ncbi:hypothetical protein KNU02_gp04 [Gordonia phage Pleakley]|uniref:Uncharacterized protein n=1 Tax=Gordonia phage Pleakley TaxID=2283246 RepID=A0A345M6C2_9CAUD|nr:hypothetical protein KNU02_gp04 [Gordonia phage Pleakley]AXH49730.1 hypothetical protein SEA_FURY_4 [Gordonia phage Fury]AXH66043.1 hypothetical protein SEA_PLEAKLEY_4 [Gordonia phage Pleakley]
MAHKVKLTFYCDEADCKVNQTFVTSLERPFHTLSGRGDSQSVMTVLTKTMGWRVLTAGMGTERRIVSLCPRHAESPWDSGLTSI